MNDWNRKQQEDARANAALVVEAVRNFTAENGYAPTRAELAAATGLSERNVRKQIDRLVAEDVLVRGPSARTLRVAKQPGSDL